MLLREEGGREAAASEVLRVAPMLPDYMHAVQRVGRLLLSFTTVHPHNGWAECDRIGAAKHSQAGQKQQTRVPHAAVTPRKYQQGHRFNFSKEVTVFISEGEEKGF